MRCEQTSFPNSADWRSLKFLTEKQVSEITGLSTKTLQRWRLSRNIGPEWRRLGTSAIRYPSQSLTCWLQRSPRGGEVAA